MESLYVHPGSQVPTCLLHNMKGSISVRSDVPNNNLAVHFTYINFRIHDVVRIRINVVDSEGRVAI